MKPPSVIYLQFYDSEDGTSLDPSRWEEITWCRDRISKYDLVYDLRLKTNNDPREELEECVLELGLVEHR